MVRNYWSGNGRRGYANYSRDTLEEAVKKLRVGFCKLKQDEDSKYPDGAINTAEPFTKEAQQACGSSHCALYRGGTSACSDVGRTGQPGVPFDQAGHQSYDQVLLG